MQEKKKREVQAKIEAQREENRKIIEEHKQKQAQQLSAEAAAEEAWKKRSEIALMKRRIALLEAQASKAKSDKPLTSASAAPSAGSDAEAGTAAAAPGAASDAVGRPNGILPVRAPSDGALQAAAHNSNGQAAPRVVMPASAQLPSGDADATPSAARSNDQNNSASATADGALLRANGGQIAAGQMSSKPVASIPASRSLPEDGSDPAGPGSSAAQDTVKVTSHANVWDTCNFYTCCSHSGCTVESTSNHVVCKTHTLGYHVQQRCCASSMQRSILLGWVCPL